MNAMAHSAIADLGMSLKEEEEEGKIGKRIRGLP
jgi:hypothetical protein